MAMEKKLLVTQALDERDLLIKKINDKIGKAVFTDVVKHNEERVYNRRITREEFAKEAQSAYQQIVDLIDRYNKLDAAIVESNANTYLETSYGKYSVAGAITLRNRMRGDKKFEGKADFETNLLQRMALNYKECIRVIETKNGDLEETAQEMRYSILGKDSKQKDEKPLEVVDTYIKENKMEFADPLNVVEKMNWLQEKNDRLLQELETQIKISNATTFITLMD